MESKQILEIAVRAADSKRSEDIVALDVSKISLLADYFMITNANSARQIDAIVDEIIEKEEEAGVTVFRVEGRTTNRWVLIDFGEVVVHVFQTSEREFYQLEKLWQDAPLVNLELWLVEN